jgi:hypothetical protein
MFSRIAVQIKGGQPEINQHQFPVTIEQKIVGFQIAMDHIQFMDGLEYCQHVLHHVMNQFRRQWND